jgi:hypothetical protein
MFSLFFLLFFIDFLSPLAFIFFEGGKRMEEEIQHQEVMVVDFTITKHSCLYTDE